MPRTRGLTRFPKVRYAKPWLERRVAEITDGRWEYPTSKYPAHQGKKEMERRKKQYERAVTS